jgi:hypothetical protein
MLLMCTNTEELIVVSKGNGSLIVETFLMIMFFKFVAQVSFIC